jgi:DNA polymerase-1
MNLYLIDGNNVGFRAHCVHTDLTLDGEPVGAIYGTVRILTKFVHEFPPGKIIMPFDVAKSVYRLAIYPQYKGNRNTNPKQAAQRKSFGIQLPWLINLVNMYGVTTLAEEIRGIEADDAIAYLVHLFREGELPTIHKVIIVSSDKDLCALVADKVTWYDPVNNLVITPRNFKEQFEVDIAQYPEYKMLKGDSSDNIPHPPGIGETRAAKLLAEYGSLAGILAVKHSKVFPHTEVLDLARKLVTLDLHTKTPEDAVWERIKQKIHSPTKMDANLYEMLGQLEFNSLLGTWDEDAPIWEQYSHTEL